MDGGGLGRNRHNSSQFSSSYTDLIHLKQHYETEAGYKRENEECKESFVTDGVIMGPSPAIIQVHITITLVPLSLVLSLEEPGKKFNSFA